ncbi:methyltransferase domain-containing protein [Salipaludibacillus sp. HK11]|uniref:methyltransferase domain-containing protein n=1 Tax=Salipaludibacillus sp. HK11 TaxID=3394320 RepID=UPI0039FCB977
MKKTELYSQLGIAMTCRSYQEYENMFMLERGLFSREKTLDIASGASSFSAELNHMGYEAIAIDPLYRLSCEEIDRLGREEIKIASQKLSKNKDRFVWNYYHNVEHHDEIRNLSLDQFLDSYRRDTLKEKYVAASLPSLPFDNDTFSFVFCNHFLFLYQEQFDYAFHLEAILEMLRVTKKGGSIYIYPLVGFKDELYPQLNQLIESLIDNGFNATLTETNFRFLPSATHFLKVKK